MELNKYKFTYAEVTIFKDCFYVKWGCENFGFGEFTIRTKPDGTLVFDTECTNEEFILSLMSYIMNKSEIR